MEAIFHYERKSESKSNFVRRIFVFFVYDDGVAIRAVEGRSHFYEIARYVVWLVFICLPMDDFREFVQ